MSVFKGSPSSVMKKSVLSLGLRSTSEASEERPPRGLGDGQNPLSCLPAHLDQIHAEVHVLQGQTA